MKQLLILVFLSFFLTQCTQKVENPTTNSIPENATVEHTTQIPAPTQVPLPDDFSICKGPASLSLLAWDNEVNLSDILGTPLDENTHHLGSEADTFSGSYIKDLTYDGLKVTLMSPKDNGKSFWVLNMTATSDQYTTIRGSKIGDPLSALKTAYPEATIAKDGRTDENNCMYCITQAERYLHMEFEVTDGKISKITMYQELP